MNLCKLCGSPADVRLRTKIEPLTQRAEKMEISGRYQIFLCIDCGDVMGNLTTAAEERRSQAKSKGMS